MPSAKSKKFQNKVISLTRLEQSGFPFNMTKETTRKGQEAEDKCIEKLRSLGFGCEKSTKEEDIKLGCDITINSWHGMPMRLGVDAKNRSYNYVAKISYKYHRIYMRKPFGFAVYCTFIYFADEDKLMSRWEYLEQFVKESINIHKLNEALEKLTRLNLEHAFAIGGNKEIVRLIMPIKTEVQALLKEDLELQFENTHFELVEEEGQKEMVRKPYRVYENEDGEKIIDRREDSDHAVIRIAKVGEKFKYPSSDLRPTENDSQTIDKVILNNQIKRASNVSEPTA